MTKATIIDLSHNNADVQFGQLKEAGVLAVFLKASQGESYRDPTFADRCKRARSVGLRVGAYHFIDDSRPLAQLHNFYAVVNGMGPLVQALDFETNPSGGDATAAICGDMLFAIVDDYSRHPVIYGSDYLAKLAAGPVRVEAALCPLWEARYSTHQPTAPLPFDHWSIWQYSENAPLVIGGSTRTDIDLSVYNPALWGSAAAFTSWWDSRAVSVDL